MEDLYDPEEKIFCPYNKSHHIRRCKMSYHLVKCKQSYTDMKMVPCDFNATHVVLEPELPYHMETCPDRKKIEATIMKAIKKTEDKYPVPKIDVPCEENWDNDNYPTYNPQQVAEQRNVLRHLDVVSGSKRKNFRLQERKRLAQLENQTNVQSPISKALHLPPHRDVKDFGKGLPSQSELGEKFKMGQNKVFYRNNPKLNM